MTRLLCVSILIGLSNWWCLHLEHGVAQTTEQPHSEGSKTKQDIDAAIFYRSTLAAAEKALRLNETGEAKYWLAQSPASFRAWEWEFLTAQSDVSLGFANLGDSQATALDVSRDGKLAAIAFDDGSIALYSLPALQKLETTMAHQGAVYSVAFSFDNKHLVSASRDTTSRVWDVETGNEVSRIELDNPGVAAATFSPNGDQVATCTWLITEESGAREIFGVVWIWDSSSGEVVHKTRVGVKPLDSIAWSNDGERIAVGSWDGLVHVLTKDTNEVATLHIPKEGIYTAVISVAISADGQRIACGSKDRTSRVWDLEKGTLIATMSGHEGFVNEVSFSNSERELWTASADGTIRYWDIENAEQLSVYRGHEGSIVGLAHVPQPESRETIAARQRSGLPSDELTREHEREFCSVSLDGTIRRWSTTSSAEVNQKWRFGKDGTYTTVWSPDGTQIYVACYDGTVQVVDAKSGATLDEWAAHKGSTCNTLALSKDGRRLLTCSWDETMRLWDPIEHKLVRELHLDAGVFDCAISPDGTLAAAVVDGALEVWDLDSGELVSRLRRNNGHAITEVSFSPDGKRLVAAETNFAALVWDTDEQQIVAELKSERTGISTVSWSPNGDRIATAGNGWVDVWHAQSFELENTYRFGDRVAKQLAFSVDGRRLFVAADAITVIDPAHEGTLLRFQPCDDDIYYLAASPNGMQLASCTTGGLISVVSSRISTK